MHLIFTISDSVASKLITEMTDEPSSHVAIHFPKTDIIVHSDFLGLGIDWLSATGLTVVSRLKRKDASNPDADYAVVKELYTQKRSCLYDFGAFIFLGLCLAARKYLKIPLPKSNLWQSSGMMICTEWASSVLGASDPMLTPWKLREKLLNSGQWIEVESDGEQESR